MSLDNTLRLPVDGVSPDSCFLPNCAPESLPSVQLLRERIASRVGLTSFRRGPGGYRQDVVLMPEYNCVVEIAGHRVHRSAAYLIQELQNLYHLLQDPIKGVRVPALYGWRVEDGETFVYMELIPGTPLEDALDSVNEDEKEEIVAELKGMAQALADYQPQSYIDSLQGGPPADFTFRMYPFRHRFNSIQDFHDAFLDLSFDRFTPESEEHAMDLTEYRKELRPGLRDDWPVHFTHGDLHTSNIMVSKVDGQWRVLAVIDWEQAGYMPMYWESCKASWGFSRTSDWFLNWIPQWLDREQTQYLAWENKRFHVWRFLA